MLTNPEFWQAMMYIAIGCIMLSLIIAMTIALGLESFNKKNSLDHDHDHDNNPNYQHRLRLHRDYDDEFDIFSSEDINNLQ